MSWRQYFCLAACVGCGTVFAAIDGVTGFGFLILLALTVLGSIYLGDWIALRHWRKYRVIQICLLASVIAIVAVIFFVAFVNGADAVSATPGWAWRAFVCYAGAVMVVGDRLSRPNTVSE